MNKEIIEKYIQFGINNGYENKYTIFDMYGLKEDINKMEVGDFSGYLRGLLFPYYYTVTPDEEQIIGYISLEKLITSKDFIEAIARGLIRQRFSKNALEENIQNAFKSSVFQGKVKEITHNQADAIRDLKLEEFIENLLK